MVVKAFRRQADCALWALFLLPLAAAGCDAEPTVLLGRLMPAGPSSEAGVRPTTSAEPSDESRADEQDHAGDLAHEEHVADVGSMVVANPTSVVSDAGPMDAGSMVASDAGRMEELDAAVLDASTREDAGRRQPPPTPRGAEPVADASRPETDPHAPDGGRGGREGEHGRE